MSGPLRPDWSDATVSRQVASETELPPVLAMAHQHQISLLVLSPAQMKQGSAAKVKFLMSCLSQSGNIVVQLFKRTTYRLKNTFCRFVVICSVQSVAALDHMSSHIGLAPALVSIVLDHLANSKLGRARCAAEKQNNVAAQRRRDLATFISNPRAQILRQVQGA